MFPVNVGHSHPTEQRLPIKPGAGNGTKNTNRTSVFLTVTLNPFPTNLFLKSAVVEGGEMSKAYLLPSCSSACFKNQYRPEKWRKIGDHKEDFQGIPACKADIGN